MGGDQDPPYLTVWPQGTWRKHPDSSLGDAQATLESLMLSTLPEPARIPRTSLPVRRAPLSLADGNPGLHTDTVKAPHVHRSAAGSPPRPRAEPTVR